jgi:hypothetical protein
MTGKRCITNYTISGNSSDNNFLRFPTGMEYYQVITSMTVSQMVTLQAPPSGPGWEAHMQDASYYRRIFDPWTRFINMDVFNGGLNPTWSFENGWQKYSDKSAVYVTILMRGVDPHSTSQPMRIGLGRIFAKLNHWDTSVYGNFKLNIPMQPNDGLDFGSGYTNQSQSDAQNFAHRCVKHDLFTSNNPTTVDTNYSKGRLFFKPYHFIPNQNNWTSFTTKSPYNFIKTSESDFQENTVAGYDTIPATLPYQMANAYTSVPSTGGRGIRIGNKNYYSYADYVNNPFFGNV